MGERGAAVSTSEDVSWDTLRRIIRQWAGNGVDIAEIRHLHGGAVSNTLGLTLDDGRKAVLKISPHRVDRSLVREAQQLNHLRFLGVPVPTVYQWRLADLDEPDSYVLMEFVEGVDLAQAKEQLSRAEFDAVQEDLARIVVTMHRQVGKAYMRVGATGTDGAEFSSWPAFFRGVYDGMWRELEKDPHTTAACRKHFNKVHDRLETLLAHDDQPRLVHWDLWTANVLVGPNGKVGAILDPVCKYAHAEAELAYLELFQTVTPAFMKAYRRELPVSPDYEKRRRDVYQLYFLMDHAAFFGGPYHEKLAAAAAKVAATL